MKTSWPIHTRIRAAFKRQIQRRWWRMDVGENCNIHPSALIDRTWPEGIHIGEGTAIAAHVVVLTHDFTRGLLVDTWIGKNCTIGERAIIMPGIRLGDGCIVLPGSLVMHDIPDRSVVQGNPAKIIAAR